MEEYILSEEEKRHIEEKIRYEEEVKARIRQEQESKKSNEITNDTILSPMQKQMLASTLEKAENALRTLIVPRTQARSLLICASETRRKAETKPKKSLLFSVLFLLAHYWLAIATPYNRVVFGIGGLFVKEATEDSFIIAALVIPLIFGIVWLVLLRILLRKFNKASANQDATLDEQRAKELTEEAQKAFEEYKPLYFFLPEKYQNAECCGHIRDALESGRASSLKEAYILCDNKLSEKFGSDYKIHDGIWATGKNIPGAGQFI